MASPTEVKNPEGVRRSQILTTYGPGSLIDLPDRAVLVAGLDHWIGARTATVLSEPRLERMVRPYVNGVARVELRVPPTPKDEVDRKGIVAWQFPAWFVAQDPDAEEAKKGRRARQLYNRKMVQGLERNDRKRIVPVRFVAACKNGHIQDIEWHRIAHANGVGDCRGGALWLDERGVTGDLGDLNVRCGKCGQSRPMSELMVDGSVLGSCQGKMPWLGVGVAETCEDDNGSQVALKLLLRHATNAYFPVNLRVISIPLLGAGNLESAAVKAVRSLSATVRSMLANVTSATLLTAMRPVLAAGLVGLESVSDEALWEAMQAAKAPEASVEEARPAEARLEELETFYALAESEDIAPNEDEVFTAHAYPFDRLGDGHAQVLGRHIRVKGFLERVVLAQRLREVQALVGFTRLEPPPESIASELDLNVRCAPIAQTETWRPAIENKGEGVFVALASDRVKAWLERAEVQEYGRDLREKLLASRYGEGRADVLSLERVLSFELPYVMLHTLSHLLLTAIALECGYSAASIRERIYIGDIAGETRFAVLLYTGTPDSEGTLGGLVEIGKCLTDHVARALEFGALCSNDPVCAQGQRAPVSDGFVHGAACHGCVLVAESSCERRNDFLDRRLVMATVAGDSLAFFRSEG